VERKNQHNKEPGETLCAYPNLDKPEFQIANFKIKAETNLASLKIGSFSLDGSATTQSIGARGETFFQDLYQVLS